MSTITTILNLIRKPKATSAELQAAISNIDTKPLETEVERLEGERRALLLKVGADDSIEALEAKIRTSNREIERLDAAKAELQRLLPEAQAQELAAEIERSAAEARRDGHDEGLRLFALAHDQVTQLAGTLAALDVCREKIRTANRFVSANGRSDLKCPFPEYTLAEHIGVTSPMKLPQFQEWRLHGYRPWSWGQEMHGTLPAERLLGRAKELIK